MFSFSATVLKDKILKKLDQAMKQCDTTPNGKKASYHVSEVRKKFVHLNDDEIKSEDYLPEYLENNLAKYTQINKEYIAIRQLIEGTVHIFKIHI